MNYKKVIFISFIALFFASCGAKKKVVQQQQQTQTPKEIVVTETPIEEPKEVVEVPTGNTSEDFLSKLEEENTHLNKKTLEYIRKFYPIALTEMEKYKIPASITLAQGILESGNGFSDLATRSNNHFGIKCHRGWTGQKVYHDDDEKGECFRKYYHPDTSYEDHSRFLVGRKRYASLFRLDKADYIGWAQGLQRAGYATDKKYPQKLISLIERYQLYKFDDVTATKRISSQEDSNTVEGKTDTYYEVKKGDTLYSIAKKNKTTVARIKEINGLESNTISLGQLLLIN